MLTIPVTLLSVNDIEQEINEGHLYHEERISTDRLFDVLGEDSNKAYTNCFGAGEKARNDDKKFQSSNKSQPQTKKARD